MKNLILASVVTKKSYEEFLLLDYTIELFHKNQTIIWYLSTDSYVKEKLHNKEKYKIQNLIESDDGSHGTSNDLKNSIHMKMMMTKFDACELALKENNYVIFLDSDTFFVRSFEDKFLSLLENKEIDFIVSPHHTENKKLEADVGHFNGGFFVAKSKECLKIWKEISVNYKKLNMFYEQQPLEHAIKEFMTLSAPINYNIGWWRMNENNTRSRYDTLRLENDKIYFLNRPAIFFHAHTLKDLDYKNYGEDMLIKIYYLMKISNNANYKKIMNKISYLKVIKDEVC